MKGYMNNEQSIKFVFNYRELMTNSVSPCVLRYKILNKFKENIKVFRFNSMSKFSCDGNYKTNSLLWAQEYFIYCFSYA